MVKVREIERSAVVAWSPSGAVPMLVTASRTNDIELWELNLSSQDSEATLMESPVTLFKRHAKAEENSEDKEKHVEKPYPKTVSWGYVSDRFPCGVIAAAYTDGHLCIYNATEIDVANQTELYPIFDQKFPFNNSSDSEGIASISDISINSAPNASTIAVTGNENELVVLDLEQLETSKATDNVEVKDKQSKSLVVFHGKSTRPEPILKVAWNFKVAYILATGNSSGFVSIWDLKSQKEIIALPFRRGNMAASNSGSTSSGSIQVPVSALSWNPESSTKLAVASSEASMINLWDLKNARDPEKSLSLPDDTNFGIGSISWSQKDNRLILACTTDSKICLWDWETCRLLASFSPAVAIAKEVCFSATLPSYFSHFSGVSSNSQHANSVIVHQIQTRPECKVELDTAENDASSSSQALDKDMKKTSPNNDDEHDDFFSKLSTITKKYEPSLYIPPSEFVPRWISTGPFLAARYSNSGPEEIVFTNKYITNFDDKTQNSLKEYLLSKLTALDEQLGSSTPESIIKDLPLFAKSETSEDMTNLRALLVKIARGENLTQSIMDTVLLELNNTKKDKDLKVNKPSAFGDDEDSDFLKSLRSESETDSVKEDSVKIPNQETDDEKLNTIIKEFTTLSFDSPSPKFLSEILTSSDVGVSEIINNNYQAAVDFLIESGSYSDAYFVAQLVPEPQGIAIRQKVQSCFWQSRKNESPIVCLSGLLASKNFTPLTENIDLASWRELLRLLTRFCGNDESLFKKLTSMIGHRLLKAGDMQASLICFVASENVANLVSLSLKDEKKEEISSELDEISQFMDSYTIVAKLLHVFRLDKKLIDDVETARIQLNLCRLLFRFGDRTECRRLLELVPDSLEETKDLKKILTPQIKKPVTMAQKTPFPSVSPRKSAYAATHAPPEPLKSTAGITPPHPANVMAPPTSTRNNGWNDLPDQFSAKAPLPKRSSASSNNSPYMPIKSPFPNSVPQNQSGTMSNSFTPPPPPTSLPVTSPPRGNMSQSPIPAPGNTFAAPPKGPYNPFPAQTPVSKPPQHSSMYAPKTTGQTLQSGNSHIIGQPSGLSAPPMAGPSTRMNKAPSVDAPSVANADLLSEKQHGAPPLKPGDRSQILPEDQLLYKLLSNEFDRVRQSATSSNSVAPHLQKTLQDIEKRLGIFFDHLNQQTYFSRDLLTQMQVLAQALAGRDYTLSRKIYIELITTRASECEQWMVGVKRLIQLAEAI